MRIPGRKSAIAAVAYAFFGAAGCASSDEQQPAGAARASLVPTEIRAQLPLHTGQLYGLCPVTDLPRESYNERARTTRRQAKALIREVRRRPNAVIERVFEDAHTREELRERVTVLELAEEHLREPGIEGAPCARTVMTELRDVVARARGEEPPKSATPHDEPVFLIDEVAAKLRLRQRGTVYRNAYCREVQEILTSREEVEVALDEPIENVEVVAAPERTVGVEVFRPTARCRGYLERRLGAVGRGG